MIIADAGPLVAAMDRGDPWHERVASFLANNRDPIIVPALVVAEVGYFLERRLGPPVEASFLRQLGQGAILVEQVLSPDYLRAADLIEQMLTFHLGLWMR